MSPVSNTARAEQMSNVEPLRRSYLDEPHGLKAWLLTKDHKRIAMLYLISITIFFAIGGMFAIGIRAELATPKGDMFQPDMYNKLFTLHGSAMMFGGARADVEPRR